MTQDNGHSPEDRADVTRLLDRLNDGDHAAWNELLPLVYGELRRLAHAQRRHGHGPAYATLNTTALVHEAYLKLADRAESAFHNQRHFFRLAARAIRDISVDYARRQQAAKRGGDAVCDPLDEAIVATAFPLTDAHFIEILAVHQALEQLARLDNRQAEIVELRYFGGLTIPETADVLALSPATVKREWTTARAWLYRSIR